MQFKGHAGVRDTLQVSAKHFGKTEAAEPVTSQITLSPILFLTAYMQDISTAVPVFHISWTHIQLLTPDFQKLQPK